MRNKIDEFEDELERFREGLRQPRPTYHDRLLEHVRLLAFPSKRLNPTELRWAWLRSVCLRQKEQIADLQTHVDALEDVVEVDSNPQVMGQYGKRERFLSLSEGCFHRPMWAT